jgi:hypothetical protein
MTEYWARMGFPWFKLDDPAHKDFLAKVDNNELIKHSTTNSCAKLPLLFDEVKSPVSKKSRKNFNLQLGLNSLQITRLQEMMTPTLS